MMETVLQKSGRVPYSMFVMASVLLLAATAYPKSLDAPTTGSDTAKVTGMQCTLTSGQTAGIPQR